MSELPSIWMRTTTPTFFPCLLWLERCQNYRPFEWGLRHSKGICTLFLEIVRITVHLNEDYDTLIQNATLHPYWSELPSIWMRTTTSYSTFFWKRKQVRITVHLNEDYDDYFYSPRNVKSDVRITVHLNEDYDLRLLCLLILVGVRITVHLNEDYDKWHMISGSISPYVRITVHLNEDYDRCFWNSTIMAS